VKTNGRSRVTEGQGVLVSILIPAHNAEEWMADTLRSAIAQTWEQKEIIVVDDGSTDQTLAIARQFESDGVRVVTQENQGAAAARNRAFSLSRGEYIQWLDADDLLGSDKIARQMKALDHCQSRRTLLSSAWGRFMYRSHRAEFVPTSLWCDLSPAEWILRKMEENVFMQTATWLVSRELTEAAGPWNTELLGDDDGEYFCRVLRVSDGVRFVPEARVYFRTPFYSSLSYLEGQSDKKLEAYWRSMKLHIAYLRSMEESERSRAACVKYLQTSLLHFYPARIDIVHDMEHVASGLGGKVTTPSLSWKYAWIRLIFGWKVATRAQKLLRQIKWTGKKAWDKLAFCVDKWKLIDNSRP
jgi:glycosyltransferase involved in cell wall biosynthesis